MENHPIPQDVTGFQFRLIGDMTVKQFAYLAGGVIIAWIFFSLPIHFLIKSPFVLLFAAFGASLAFVPIEGRPMDLMIGNFLKALVSPNQFVYQKAGGTLFPEHLASVQPKIQKFVSSSSQNLESLLSSIPKAPKNKLDEKELSFFKSLPLSGMGTQSPAVQKNTLPQPPHIPSPTPILQPQSPFHVDTAPLSQKKTPEKESKLLQALKDSAPRIITAEGINQSPVPQKSQTISSEQMIHQDEILEQKAETIKHQLDTIQNHAVPTQQTLTPQNIESLQKQLSEVLSQKAHLEKQLAELASKFQQKPPRQMYTPSTMPQPKKESSHIHKIPKNMAPKLGIPFTPDVPNLIAGIIKDARGNILPNILVEVKDKDDNPVRAFKTNSLGQFASATPLVNGTYTISFEDPQGNHNFETIEIAANGTLIPPLEVLSFDAREELRRSLFGS